MVFALRPQLPGSGRDDAGTGGGEVDHTTIYRWVQSYSPDIEKRCKPHLQPTNDSYRVDETMHMIRKGQIEGIKKGDVKNQIQFIENLFELAT